MAGLALGVVVLFAALLAVFVQFYRSLDRRLAALEIPPRNVYATRYSPPVVDEVDHTGVPLDLDTAGCWAMEQAERGVRVSDEEIALQRRMRTEAGL